MQRYNIVVPKEYDQNGETKTSWNDVGTLVEFPADGQNDKGFIVELNMFPDTKFKVFPQDNDGNQQQSGGQQSQTQQPPHPNEEMDDNDIPF